MLRNTRLVLATLSACFSAIQCSPTLKPRDDPSSSQPACSSANLTTISYEANYDDLPALTSPRSRVPVPYAGLNHSTWFVESYLGPGGMVPASGSQYAISYDYREAREFNTFFNGSRVESFDLQSLSYACSQGIPSNGCTILIMGYKKRPATSHAVYKTLDYPAFVPPVDPATIVMRNATFGAEWSGLEKVTMQVTSVQPELAGLVVDKVAYAARVC